MQINVVCVVTSKKQWKMAVFFLIFQFLMSPLIHGVEKQNLYFLSCYHNVFKYTVKSPMH